MKRSAGSLIASTIFLVGTSEAFGVAGPRPAVAFKQPRDSSVAFASVPDRDIATVSSTGK
jgi:hypothetical protein